MHTLLATRRALGFALRARITRAARALLYAQECGVGLFANLAVPRASRSSLVANGCLQHTFLSLRQYPDNAMLHRNAFSSRFSWSSALGLFHCPVGNRYVFKETRGTTATC